MRYSASRWRLLVVIEIYKLYIIFGNYILLGAVDNITFYEPHVVERIKVVIWVVLYRKLIIAIILLYAAQEIT